MHKKLRQFAVVAAPVLLAGSAALGLAGSATAAAPTAGPAAARTPAVRAQTTPPVNITSSSCPSNIVQGDTGTCVVALQDLLSNWGYWEDLGPSGANGQFGPDTQSAVVAFQTAAGIGVDGQVGPQTKAALYSNANPYMGYQATFMNAYDQDVNSSAPYWCLDADVNTVGQNGQKVQGWQCESGDANQAWDVYTVPYSSHSMIVSAHDGACLDANGGESGQNGQVVEGWACNGGKNQQWYVGSSSIADWENAGDSECLDADTNTARQDGQKIQDWACNGTSEQYWNEGEA